MWFGTNIVTNLKNMIQAVNFPLSFLNSCIVTFGNVILVLFFCSIGGYAFAVYQFPGRKVLFAVLLGTMMVPWTAGIIPWFIMMSKLGRLNSFQALIIPSSANAFGLYWIMQFVNVWNDFMQPLMILRRPEKMTLPLMLKTMVGDRGTDYGALMFASTCAVLPLLIAFLSASKFFMSGLTSGAVKE